MLTVLLFQCSPHCVVLASALVRALNLPVIKSFFCVADETSRSASSSLVE